jgi:4-hydroxybenzoyl-CoA reductase subunit alpha
MSRHCRDDRKRPGVPLIDGIEKVTGRARYTADLDHADALVGRVLRSPVSHGEIIRLDVSKAVGLEGVMAVVTGADCPQLWSPDNCHCFVVVE